MAPTTETGTMSPRTDGGGATSSPRRYDIEIDPAIETNHGGVDGVERRSTVGVDGSNLEVAVDLASPRFAPTSRA